MLQPSSNFLYSYDETIDFAITHNFLPGRLPSVFRRNRFLVLTAFFFLRFGCFTFTENLSSLWLRDCSLVQTTMEHDSSELVYSFYDSSYEILESPQTFGWFYQKNNSFLANCYTLWPQLAITASPIAISCGSFYQSVFNDFQPLVFFVRKRRLWQNFLGLYSYLLTQSLTFFFFSHYVLFQIVGIGYFCEFVAERCVRVVVSNTTDLLLLAPQTLTFGVVPPVGDNTVSTIFWFRSQNYQFLRAYAHYVRQLVSFNVYEYKGLLYLSEVKKKKITKRKTK